eukprot:3115561-Amphidinium_carterae.2
MPGNARVAYWKDKCSIPKILENTQDMRSMTGLKRAWGRRASKDTGLQDGAILKQYYYLCQNASQVSVKTFPSCSTDDVNIIIPKLLDEGYTLPGPSHHDCATACCCVESTSFWQRTSIKVCGNFFHRQEEKLDTFKRTVFDELLGKLLLKGAEAHQVVHDLCLKCLSITESVDVALLELAAVKVLSEAEAVCKCLVALASKTLLQEHGHWPLGDDNGASENILESKATLQAASKLFLEAQTVFPTDATLQEMGEKVGSCMATCDEKQLVTNYKAYCTSLLNANGTGIDGMKAGLNDESRTLNSVIVTKLLDFIKAQWSVGTHARLPLIVSQLQESLNVMLPLMSDGKDKAELFLVGAALLDSHAELVDKEAELGHELW